jgi:hypothetical protein
VAGDRLLRILAMLVHIDDDPSAARARLCDVGARVTEVSGAGIMLMVGDSHRGSLCSSDAVSATIEDLQFTLGEGPCIDAYRERRPVLDSDLEGVQEHRWPAFTPAAIEAGARAVFGFPIQVGVIRLGALNLYRNERGPLTENQHADAIVMADVAGRAIVEMHGPATVGSFARELERGANLELVVHQASGMVSVQLGISVGEALLRLRAHAFASDLSLAEVATQVVRRQLRFDGPDAAA